MDYFSRKPDFPTFEDIYIARAQGAIGLERRGDEVSCRFGPDGPVIMLPQGASQGDGGARARPSATASPRRWGRIQRAALRPPGAWTRTSPRSPGGRLSVRRAEAIAFSHAMSI